MSLFPIFSPGGLEFSYLQTSAESTFGPSISFANQSIGSPDPGRLIIAVFQFSGDGALPVSDITIGGVSATAHVANEDTGAMVVIASAVVPTGTSATVAASAAAFSGVDGVVSLYRAVGLESTTPTDTASDDDDVLSMVIDVSAGGFVVACAAFAVTGSIVTTGLSEDSSANFGGVGTRVSASQGSLPAEIEKAISFDGPTGNAAAAAVSFR